MCDYHCKRNTLSWLFFFQFRQFSVGAIFRSVDRASDGKPVYEAYSETYR